jgi:uncharacterized membrane protein YdjX (TVP38/TMEM64 family)
MLKLLWNKISGAFLAVIAIVVGSMALFFYGKHKGKEDMKNEQTKETLETAVEIKKDEVARVNDNIVDVKRRLRDRYTRK